MDKKDAREFSNDAIYGLNEMLTLTDEQTQEIEYLNYRLVNITTNPDGRITHLETQIYDLTKSS